MVSSLIRQIMEAKGLRQADLAEILGVSIDRVKSITSGRVKKLSGEEMQALVSRLNVRAGFLVTGEPPIFIDMAAATHAERMRNLDEAAALLAPLNLPARYMIFVRDVVVGALSGQSDQLQKTIDGFVIDEVADRFGDNIKAATEEDPEGDTSAPGAKPKGPTRKGAAKK